MSTTQIQPQELKKVVDTIPNRIKTFKIIVVGDSNVGKTSLTYRFCEGKFIESSEATIGVDFRERTLNIDGEDIKVRLLLIVILIAVSFSCSCGIRRVRNVLENQWYNISIVMFMLLW
uniref:Uncharacterized protein n=1 Tax=Photinus pyralis TaxID=7054 RepID=A0A1Y1LLA7_PHOPY